MMLASKVVKGDPKIVILHYLHKSVTHSVYHNGWKVGRTNVYTPVHSQIDAILSHRCLYFWKPNKQTNIWRNSNNNNNINNQKIQFHTNEEIDRHWKPEIRRRRRRRFFWSSYPLPASHPPDPITRRLHPRSLDNCKYNPIGLNVKPYITFACLHNNNNNNIDCFRVLPTNCCFSCIIAFLLACIVCCISDCVLRLKTISYEKFGTLTNISDLKVFNLTLNFQQNFGYKYSLKKATDEYLDQKTISV